MKFSVEDMAVLRDVCSKMKVEGYPLSDPTVTKLSCCHRKRSDNVWLDMQKLSMEEISSLVKRENDKTKLLNTREHALLEDEDDDDDVDVVDDECEIIVLSDSDTSGSETDSVTIAEDESEEKQESDSRSSSCHESRSHPSNFAIEETDSGGCIDPDHLQPCKICVSAPKEKDFGRYQLVKDQRDNKGGYDKLMSLIRKTSKWQSHEARKELADTFEDRPDFASLREILRGSKHSSHLTKIDMMRVCLSWGFKSNLWQEPQGYHQANCGGCIDPDHSQPCRVCVSAPEEKDFGRYKLVKDQGDSKGRFNKLRSLIHKTSKWQSHEARKELADTFEDRPDLATLRAILRGSKPPSFLTKTYMMRICLSWGFKSNLWQMKKSKKNETMMQDATFTGKGKRKREERTQLQDQHLTDSGKKVSGFCFHEDSLFLSQKF